MTAIIIASQRKHNCIHVCVDAASYSNADHTVSRFGCKVFPIAHWPGGVTSAGNAAAGPGTAIELSSRFATFDNVIEGASGAILHDILAPYNLPNGAEVFLFGIGRDGPQTWLFRTDNSLPAIGTREEVEASPYWAPPYTMVKLDDEILMMPVPANQVEPANYEGVDLDAEPAEVIWSLHKILEMQRHMDLPSEIGGIGGFGTVTSIYPDRIEQRVLVRWPEDRIGGRLRPEPLDWDRWHRENPKPGVSRIKRDMLARKERKLHLVR